jgi:hypothetical protein
MHRQTLLLLLFVSALSVSEIRSSKSLAVTVYNDQFAIVKDVREIAFDQGNSDLYFTDVAAKIESQTVTFKALKDTENIRVYEQNYQANLINTEAILKRFINKNVTVFGRVGSASRKVTGTLLGYQSGYVLRTADGIEQLSNIDGVSLAELPSGFFTLPTLNWKVNSRSAVVSDCEVAYRTTGFSWKSDYLLTLNQAETNADLGGWVTIDNNSGKRYESIKLKLIAGDVNTVKPPKETYLQMTHFAYA